MNRIANAINNNKKGSVLYLVLAVIMSVFFPVIAVIYDLGQMRMYQQDVKNAQEIAGLACIGVSKGSFKDGSSSALGAFNPESCLPIATVTARENLGLDGGQYTSKLKGGADLSKLNKVKSAKSRNSRLTNCKGETVRVTLDGKRDDQNFSLKVEGVCYKPKFIKADLLNFQMLKNSGFKGLTTTFKDEYPVEVRPSGFSAVYNVGG